MNRAQILAVLEAHSSACLDDAGERERVATALATKMHAHPDALFIREVFEGCTSGGRIIKFGASNGKLWGLVLDAAWRLAGGQGEQAWVPTPSAGESGNRRASAQGGG
jgi:hypothetical protein